MEFHQTIFDVSCYSYIEEERDLQEEFVSLLDSLCHSGGRLLARSVQSCDSHMTIT